MKKEMKEEDSIFINICKDFKASAEDYKKVALEYKKATEDAKLGRKRWFISTIVLFVLLVGLSIYTILLLDSMNHDIGLIQQEIQEHEK